MRSFVAQLGCFITFWAVILMIMSVFFWNSPYTPWEIFLVLGIIALFIGIGMVLYVRPVNKRYLSVLEIIKVREEVTVSKIQQETELDREFIIKAIKHALVNEHVYGDLSHDDETFTRNTSPRPASHYD